jgi:enoyl-CoA hydratase/carnithine racemase
LIVRAVKSIDNGDGRREAGLRLPIAVEGATFSVPEVGVGIVPGAGGTQRLPRLIDPTRAKEKILTSGFP